MSDELGIAAGATLGNESGVTKQTADLSGQPCQNCGTLVSQRYCPNCGQLAASFHRPLWNLIGESITDTFAIDGRAARTLPMLMFRPGRVTRNYIDGKRARYVPPFRLLLLSSLVFFFAFFAVMSAQGWMENLVLDDTTFSEEQREEVRASISEMLKEMENDPEMSEADRAIARSAITGFTEPYLSVTPEDNDEALDGETAGAGANLEISDDGVTMGANWKSMNERAREIISNEKLFTAQIQKWAPRISLLMIPVSILTFGVMYVWRRRIYMYDHAIHALHIHSWIYLFSSVLLLLSPWLGGWSFLILSLGLFVYAWCSFAVVYDTGPIRALLRLMLLGLVWLTVGAFLFSAILILSAVGA